jgi:hypothetical protein
MRSVAITLILAATLSCAGSQPSLRQNYRVSTCPGSPPLHCLTAPECDYDLGRQCNMCRCSSANGEGTTAPVNAEGIPPIH